MMVGLYQWRDRSTRLTEEEKALLAAALAQVGTRKLAFSTGITRVFGRGDDQRELAVIISDDEVVVVADSPNLPDDVRAQARPNFGNARTGRLLERAQTFLYFHLELRDRHGDPENLPI